MEVKGGRAEGTEVKGGRAEGKGGRAEGMEVKGARAEGTEESARVGEDPRCSAGAQEGEVAEWSPGAAPEHMGLLQRHTPWYSHPAATSSPECVTHCVRSSCRSQGTCFWRFIMRYRSRNAVLDVLWQQAGLGRAEDAQWAVTHRPLR